MLADTAVLATLPPRELRAGYAEIVKAGLIGDAAFFAWCETQRRGAARRRRGAAGRSGARACAFKAAVVGDDEREEKPSDGRALLNLGHTFGHALEAEIGYGGSLLHGEAVAIGLAWHSRLSARLGLCPATDAGRVTAHLASVGMPAALADAEPPLIGGGAARAHAARQEDARRHASPSCWRAASARPSPRRDVPPQAVLDLLREEGCTE